MIQIDHLSATFGRFRAVDDVSFRIEPGQSVALWGSNGAGKSTIIRCVLGLVPFKGDIRIAGRDARRDGKQARRAIGYVPQELGFYDDLRVREAVRYFARLKGERPADQSAVLASVGLAGHESKRVRELSGGMKQRLALALAMIGDPPILVLDEVTASLDSAGREHLTDVLASLRAAGRTLFFASHRPAEIRALADRVILLERGRIIRESAPADLDDDRPAAALLRIRMPAPTARLAIDALHRRGIHAHLNGVGILVPAAEGARAAAVHALAQDSIPFDDFEFIQPGDAHAAHPAPARSETRYV
ncbi:MAG: ABC transporter ATP-binding protein [Phycisphaerales bacterium]|nr:ABC transporter ATP-binding protein [Phycisphaerales bacterium]